MDEWVTNFQKLTSSFSNLSPKLKFLFLGGGWIQLLTFDAKSKSAKIPNSLYIGVGVGGAGIQFLTFDTESKSAKIPNSLYGRGKGRAGVQL